MKKVKLHFLVDAVAAETADKILADLGIPLSDAVNMMFHQVRIKRGLPFDLHQARQYEEPEPTPMDDKIFKSAEELWASLPKLK